MSERRPAVAGGRFLTNDGAGNILRGWRGGRCEDWPQHTKRVKSEDNAETQRARSSAEKRLAPKIRSGRKRRA
jgi:hypothetical protein